MNSDDFTKARSLADKLMVTCQPSEFWDDLDELTKEQCLALDTIAFECAGCNHWFPVSGRHEERGLWVCTDCKD